MSNRGGTIFAPLAPTLFVVEIGYELETEECVAIAKTWVSGPEVGYAVGVWKRKHPGVVVKETRVLCGEGRRWKGHGGGGRTRRTGSHPSIAA